MKLSCSTQPWFDKEIYTLVQIDSFTTPLGKQATWKNFNTGVLRNLFFDILEPLSEQETITLIRDKKLEEIGI
jgi:hypothetical protein